MIFEFNLILTQLEEIIKDNWVHLTPGSWCLECKIVLNSKRQNRGQQAIMGLDFSDSKSFHTKIVWRTIISNQKNLDPNFFPTHFSFPSSIFSYQNVFQTNKKIRAKLFWNQKIFRTKLSQTTNFTGQKTLYQHLFLPNFFSGPRIFSNQKYFRLYSFSNQPNWLWHKSKFTLLIFKIRSPPLL